MKRLLAVTGTLVLLATAGPALSAPATYAACKAPKDAIVIDGSEGEGGGQILRTSLALSLITGRPFHLIKLRARRHKPGLLRQHLTAVRAATSVGNDA